MPPLCKKHVFLTSWSYKPWCMLIFRYRIFSLLKITNRCFWCFIPSTTSCLHSSWFIVSSTYCLHSLSSLLLSITSSVVHFRLNTSVTQIFSFFLCWLFQDCILWNWTGTRLTAYRLFVLVFLFHLNAVSIFALTPGLKLTCSANLYVVFHSFSHWYQFFLLYYAKKLSLKVPVT